MIITSDFKWSTKEDHEQSRECANLTGNVVWDEEHEPAYLVLNKNKRFMEEHGVMFKEGIDGFNAKK